MKRNHWSLVLFTLMTQTAVGFFVCLVVLEKTLPLDAFKITTLGFGYKFTVSMMLISMTFSILHLGQPLNAPRTILNLGNSWLSAEIVSTLVFTAMCGVIAVDLYLVVLSELMRGLIKITGCSFGLVLIHSMSKTYRIRTIPAWNSISTEISFFKSSFLLGSIVCYILFSVNYIQGPLLEIFIFISTLILLDFILTVFKHRNKKRKMGRFFQQQKTKMDEIVFLWGKQFLLLFGGLGTLFLFSMTVTADGGDCSIFLYLLVFLAVIAAEVFDRWWFYRSYTGFGGGR